MWKYGGVYSDLDTITVKSFLPLIESGEGGFGYLYENKDSMGVGLLVFSRPRHPFLQYLVEKFPMNYDPDDWGKNGPILAMDSLKFFCNTDNLSFFFYNDRKNVPDWFRSIINERIHRNCQDLFIYPENYFYPLSIPNRDFEKAFQDNYLDELLSKISPQDTYSVHFYGQLSKKFTSKADDKSLYVYLASKNCKLTFNYVESNGMIFN